MLKAEITELAVCISGCVAVVYLGILTPQAASAAVGLSIKSDFNC